MALVVGKLHHNTERPAKTVCNNLPCTWTLQMNMPTENACNSDQNVQITKRRIAHSSAPCDPIDLKIAPIEAPSKVGY